MKMYPGRVFSHPEFMALPPYVFSGADFALMPSRDEPFGLVAVEFGRKGVLCVGTCVPELQLPLNLSIAWVSGLIIHLMFFSFFSPFLTASLKRKGADSKLRAGARVGGLGNMPGWWFTIESTTSRHFIQQFKMAIDNALRSKPDVRAIMRARATKQRFPVSQWVEDLEKLQSSAIEISHKQGGMEKRPTFESPNTPTILETPGMLSILRTRAPPSKRPRPAVVTATNRSSPLSTISESHSRSIVRPHFGVARSQSEMSEVSDQGRLVTSFSEGRLLSKASPGLGSKMGPSSKRKAPPRLILNTSPNMIAKTNVQAVRSQTDEDLKDDNQRPSIPRSLTSLNVAKRPPEKEQGTRERVKRPEPKRSQTMPQLHPDDRKVVRLLGMRLSSKRASELIAPKHSPKSSDGTSPRHPSSPSTPVTPDTGYFTPPTTPTPPPSRQRVSFYTNSTAPTAVSGDNSVSGNNSEGTATSITDDSSGAKSLTTTAQNPDAVDSFPSLGSHKSSHGGIPVLSTSDVKGQKPDNILQNVTPFFSDPDKIYETIFKQKMKSIKGKTSENNLCIEEFLVEREKSWYTKIRAAELRKASEAQAPQQRQEIREEGAREDQFGLGDKYKPPSGLKRVLRMKIGDWPVYSFLLAFVRDTIPSFTKGQTLLTLNYP